MKRSIKNLIGFTLGASDGEIGKVKELYFDDETWTIRYLIVDTGNWLSGRLVLISPEALLLPDWENKTVPVNLTKEQIANSPDINTDVPVSRQEEIRLYKHYPWAAYWGPGFYGVNAPADVINLGINVLITESQAQQQVDETEEAHDKHLRSTAKVIGYTIHATDGKIGDVEDFLVDDITWKIDFMVIDTGHWFPGKKVLITPNRIINIDWKTSTVFINASVDHVKSSPAYDATQEMTEVYTMAHHDHYNSLVL